MFNMTCFLYDHTCIVYAIYHRYFGVVNILSDNSLNIFVIICQTQFIRIYMLRHSYIKIIALYPLEDVSLNCALFQFIDVLTESFQTISTHHHADFLRTSRLISSCMKYLTLATALVPSMPSKMLSEIEIALWKLTLHLLSLLSQNCV